MSNAATLTGTVLDGKYAVESLLGEGGMGAVYRAQHLGTKRIVAVKVIVPRMTGSREFVERFRREAQSAGSLRHPNVVDVTDFGFARVGDGEVAYLVMEYLDGCTLAEILDEEGKLPLAWVVDIVEQICSALDDAHGRGIIHRDLKPANIWLEPNRRGGYTVKVLDFGLAKIHETAPVAVDSFVTGTLPRLSDDLVAALSSSTIAGTAVLGASSDAGAEASPSPRPEVGQLTQIGTVLGTPFYMSPEQCRSTSTVDARSDIYAIGVIAYEMLAGRRPFDGSGVDVMLKHLTEAPEPLATAAPGISSRVADVVMSALDKRPDRRPQRATLFASTLQACAEGPGALLRRAVVVCSANPLIFVRLFLISFAPMLALRVAKLLFALVAVGRLSNRVVFVWDVVVGVLVSGVATFIAAAISRGVASLVLAQLIAAPLQTVRVRVAVSVVRHRLRPLLLGSLAFVGLIGVPIAVFIGAMNEFAERWAQIDTGHFSTDAVVRGLVALVLTIGALYVGFSNLVTYSLFPIALLVEGSGVRAALSRSKAIVARGRNVVTAITLLELCEVIIPFAFGFVFVAVVQERIANIVAVDSVATLAELLVSPVSSLAYAMIYLKLRQMGGESIDEMLREQLGQQEIPKSRWMQRMQRRVASSASGTASTDR